MAPTNRPRDRKRAKTNSSRPRAKRQPSDIEMPASINAVFATVIEELGQHSLPDMTKVREQVDILFSKAEAALAGRCFTPNTSREEEIVVGVLRRVLPELREVADDSFRFAAASQPDDAGRQAALIIERMRASPAAAIGPRLVDFFRVMCMASVERARRAAGKDVLALVADLRALLNAAARVRKRWFDRDLRDTAGGTQFLQQVKSVFHLFVQSLMGAKQEAVGSVDADFPFPPYAGPLVQRLKEARPSLMPLLDSVGSCCSSIIDGLAADLPEHPISYRNRPSKAYQGRRIAALWDLDVPVDEIVSYEATWGCHLSQDAVRMAATRARKAAATPRKARKGTRKKPRDQEGVLIRSSDRRSKRKPRD